MLFGGSVVLCLPRLCVLRALKRQRAKHQESVGAKTNREERMRNKSVDRQGEWPISGRPPPLAAGSWRWKFNLPSHQSPKPRAGCSGL